MLRSIGRVAPWAIAGGLWICMGLLAEAAQPKSPLSKSSSSKSPAAKSEPEKSEPPVISPFGPAPGNSEREDAVPGYIEMSDGSVHYGRIYMTRDKRLKIYDPKLQRQREIPVEYVKEIQCHVKKEWMEKEWRFKELANDEKLYTGRSYPSREFLHTVVLKKGKIEETGVAAVFYLIPGDYGADAAGSSAGPKRPTEPEVFMIHKRDKGDYDDTLQTLTYVKQIKFGEEAFKEGKERAARAAASPNPAKPGKPGKSADAP